MSKKQPRHSHDQSRREFVKTAAGAGLAAAAFTVSPWGSYRAWANGREYDYIVVGSGAGGGTLACRLAQAGLKVLLIEAGSKQAEGKRTSIPIFTPTPHQSPVFNPRTPVAHGFASDDPGLAWGFYVQHYRNAGEAGQHSKYFDHMNRFYQKNVYGDPNRTGIYYPRGSTIGGSTAVNAMITLYPDDQDWIEMGELAHDTKLWNKDRMREMFSRLDHAQFGAKKNPQSNSREEWNSEVLKWAQPWLRNERVNPTILGADDVTAKILYSALMGTYYSGVNLRQEMRTVLDRMVKLLESAQTTGLGVVSETVRKDAVSLFNKVHPNTWEYISDKSEGILDVPKATLQGWRFGTRDLIEKSEAQFGKGKSGLFEVQDGSLVTQVVLDKKSGQKPRAIGVKVIKAKNIYGASIEGATKETAGAEEFIRANCEVILAGGAFNTPQLLMLSGIGPEEEIAKLAPGSFQHFVSLPGVGKNLQDRYEVTITTELEQPMKALAEAKIGQENDPELRKWDTNPAQSIYSSNGVLAAITKKSSIRQGTPDLMVFALGGNFEGYKPNYSHSAANANIMSWAVLKGHTENRAGEVTLRSDKPTDTPKINFRYFDDGDGNWQNDLQAVTDGVKFVQEKLRTKLKLTSHTLTLRERIQTRNDPAARNRLEHSEKFRGTEGWREHIPAEALDQSVSNSPDPDARIKDFIRKNAWGHHASCTCKMGPETDRMAVVDSRFRVHGVDGLRVADASVFPKIPGLFIAVPTYLIGEQAADVVVQDAPPGKRRS